MRKVLLVLLLVLLGIGGISLYWVGPWRTKGAPSPQPVQSVPLFPTPLPVPSPTPTATPTPLPSPTPTPPVGRPSPTPTRALSPPHLTVRIVALTGSGLTRMVTAQLANDGGSMATGVYAIAEFFAGGTQVKVNGLDALRIDVGSVGPGQVIERQVELRFSLLDGLRLQRSGGRAVLTVYADQGTWRFEEAFQP